MIKLFIDDLEIDINESQLESLTTTYAITSFTELDGRKSSYSQTITTDLTHNVRQAFDFPNDIHSIDSFPQKYEKTARIEEDGIDIFNGVVRIDDSIKNIYTSGTVSFFLLGDNGDWLSQMKLKNVNEVDYSGYNHTYSDTVQDNSETLGLPYVYDIADRGQTTFQENPDRISVYDRYPALNLKDLIVRMYNEIGYELISDFMDSDFFENLYLPFVNEQLRISEDDKVYNRFNARRGTDNNFTGITTFYTLPYNLSSNSGSSISPYTGYPFSNLHFDTTNHWYDVPRNMKAKFTAKVKISWVYSSPGGDTEADFILYIINKETGTPTPVIGGEILKKQTFTIEENTSQTFLIESDVCLLGQGSKVMVKIFASAELATLGSVSFQDGSTFYNDLDYQLCEDNLMQWNENLPDVNQVDLISGVKHCFNLFFKTDIINKKVYSEPRDDFYNKTPLDWTSKIDLSENISITDLNSGFNKTLKIDYKNDSEDGFVSYLKDTDLKVFGHEINIENIKAKEEVETFANPLFSGTVMRNYSHIGMISDAVPVLWKGYEPAIIPSKSVNFNFRLWYYHGQTTMNAGSIMKKTSYDHGNYSFTDSIRTTNYPYFSTLDISELNDNSLYYKDETNTSGLFEKHWKNTFNTLNNGKKISLYLNINKSDLNNLDLSKLIILYIDSEPVLLAIDKISEYKPNQSTKIDFITWLSDVKLTTVQTDNSGVGTLPSSPVLMGTEGSYTSSLEDGAYIIRRTTATGFVTIFKAEKGLIQAGDFIEALTRDVNNNLINAYTLEGTIYVKATTLE